MAFQISGTTIIDNNRGLKQYGDTLYSFGNTGTFPGRVGGSGASGIVIVEEFY